MQHRIVPVVAAMAMLVACADAPSGPSTLAFSDVTASALGNPPPPAFEGSLVASFDLASGKASRLTPGLSLSVSGSSLSHRFVLSHVEFNANSEQTQYWMNFPRQPYPREWGLGTALPRGRILQKDGASVGSGIIASRDERNGGWWLIDMTQFTVPYNVFVNGCQNPNWLNCVTLNVPVVAEFVRITGRGENGEPIVERRRSNPATMSFAERF